MMAAVHIRGCWHVWLMLAAFIAHGAIFLPLLPDAQGNGGADYGYFVPQLLAGYYWYAQNGLGALPWFTPAFCAGMPFYPNMQAMYFSVPQFLTFGMGPTLAIRLTLLLFAGIGLAGTYALLRVRFRTSGWAATIAAVLFLFNGFFSFRMLVGHLTFHAFMLAPLIAYAVLARQDGVDRWRSYFDPWMFAAALFIAYMIESGMVHAFPPSMAAILVVILIHALAFGSSPWRPILRLIAACALALLLTAAKLTAAFAFLQQFPRTMIPLMGFEGIGTTLMIAFKSLFMSPPLAEGYAAIRNNEWYPGVNVTPAFHEYAYSVTIIPLIVMLAALPWALKGFVVMAKQQGVWAKVLLVAAMLGILSLPIVLNWYSPGWTDFLKAVPLIKNSSMLIRWFCLYVLVSILMTALILDRFGRIKPFVPFLALMTLVVAAGFNAMASRGFAGSLYFTMTAYNFSSSEQAYKQANSTGRVPTVSRIDWADVDDAPWFTQRNRNDALATGGSQGLCYEPMFGHRLEAYSFGALRPGCVFQPGQDLVNIKNPACMLFPEANDCRPGDHFASNEIGKARRFIEYRPFSFEMPWYQRAANLLSLGTLFAMLTALAFFAVARMRSEGYRRLNPQQPGA